MQTMISSSPPKASSLAAPTIQLENVRLAVPLPSQMPMPMTMPIAQSPPVVDHAVVPFQRPLTVGAYANSNMQVCAKAPPPPLRQPLPHAGPQPPPGPPQRQLLTGPPPVQGQSSMPTLAATVHQLQQPEPTPAQPPPPLPQGVTLNNGVLGCQHHWELLTRTHGHGCCLMCDYCYDRGH